MDKRAEEKIYEAIINKAKELAMKKKMAKIRTLDFKAKVLVKK
jgi:hypothetical protein